MTIYKLWLQKLICDCASFVTSNGILGLSQDWEEFTNKVKNFIFYYSLDATWEYKEFHRITGVNYRSYGTEQRPTELMKVLLNLMPYENQVPKIFDRIFISHSSKDIDIVKPFVKLLASIGLTKDKLFCSSVNGYGIPLGENIYDYLKREFTDKNTLVIMIMSDNYYDSKPSLNEMGAAWVMSKEYISILIKDFSFDKIEGVADSQRIGFEIGNNYRLDEFKDRLIKELRLQPTSNWEQNKKLFLSKIEECNKANKE